MPTDQILSYPKKEHWPLYAAGASGALGTGLADLFREQSAILALSRVLPSEMAWIALLIFLAIFGAGLALLYAPKSIVDAFVRGTLALSVLAGWAGNSAIPEVSSVGASPVKVSFSLIAPAFAQPAPQQGDAVLTLAFEGAPPESTQVLATNLTQSTEVGAFRMADSLALQGRLGDLIKLELSAPGYERTETVIVLAQPACNFSLTLKPSGTPLLIQRLVWPEEVPATVQPASSNDAQSAVQPVPADDAEKQRCTVSEAH